MKQQDSINIEKSNSLTIDESLGLDGTAQTGRDMNTSINSQVSISSTTRRQKTKISPTMLEDEKIQEDAEAIIREVTDLH